MTRVSLTEDYDDRSVISKLNEMDKRVKENASVVTAAEESARASAESAQETADRFAGSVGAVVQNANAQINASKALVNEAKSEVDATVTTVAQAVQTANNASASAQASAQTVAGYGDRLTAVEDKAQGNSTDIQHLEIETRDLYDRDANNVKLNYDHEQVMTGGLKVGKHDLTKAVTTDETNQTIVATLKFQSNGSNQNGDGVNHRWTNQDITAKPSSAVGSYGGIHADKNGELIRRDYFVNRSDYVTHRTTYYAHDGIGKNVDINIADDETFHFVLPGTPMSYAENEVPTMGWLKFTGQNAVDVGQNLVHTDGTEDISGRKNIAMAVITRHISNENVLAVSGKNTDGNVNKWFKVLRMKTPTTTWIGFSCTFKVLLCNQAGDGIRGCDFVFCFRNADTYYPGTSVRSIASYVLHYSGLEEIKNRVRLVFDKTEGAWYLCAQCYQDHVFYAKADNFYTYRLNVPYPITSNPAMVFTDCPNDEIDFINNPDNYLVKEANE